MTVSRGLKTNQCFNPAFTNMTGQLQAMGITNGPDDWLMKLDIPDLRRLFSDSIAGLGATVRRTMAAEVSRRMIVTAIALKRFQLKHGKLPEKLSELVPEFLPAAPTDPVDGNPLRYRLVSDGTFLLYSVGENGTDEGGDPTPLRPTSSFIPSNWYWQRGCDWIWPQAATPAEVQYFYERPPK